MPHSLFHHTLLWGLITMCGEEGPGAPYGIAPGAENNYYVGGGQISLIIEFNDPTFIKLSPSLFQLSSA